MITTTSPARRGDPEADERGPLHRGRLGQAGADQSQRADPDRVGAADAVGVVVGVVHADLQGHADHQGQDSGDRQETPPSKKARPLAAITGDRAAGSVRGRAPASHWVGVGRGAVSAVTRSPAAQHACS